MRTEPRFVKPSDYFNYIGTDLKTELALKDNESNMDSLFLMQVEDALLARIDAVTFRVTYWGQLNDNQLEHLQKAIILQAQYLIRYGDMFSDTGYDADKGFIAPTEKIQNAAVCPAAKDQLLGCGLWNHVIKNRRRYLNIDRV